MAQKSPPPKTAIPAGTVVLESKPKVAIPRPTSPGPGEYKIPTTVGKSFNSRIGSPPAATFGSSGRDVTSKAPGAPGPGTYRPLVSIGKTAISTKPSAPQYSFRGREVFGSVDMTTKLFKTPGPGAYGNVQPQKTRAPAYTLLSRHDEGIRPSTTPGPGRYPGMSSFGPQPESTIRSNTGVKFGTGKRPPLLTATTPLGPGEYGEFHGVGKQAESTRVTEPAFSFGAAKRFAAAPDQRQLRAGPGSYKLPDSVGRQPLSSQKSAPAATLAGRHSFGSPYG